MARKKADMPVVAPPTVDEVVAESAAIAEVVEASAPVDATGQRWHPTPINEIGEIEGGDQWPKDSGADSNEGGAGLPEQTTTFAAPEIKISLEGFTGDRLVRGQAFEIPVRSVTVTGADLADAPITVPVIVGSVEARGPVVPYADLRALRSTIDTLVFGCDSQRTRQDAAAPAIEILDRLIGA